MRSVFIRVLSISFGLFVCGCSDFADRLDLHRFDFPRAGEQANDALDENKCRSRGITPDYEYAFQECKRQMAAERADAEAAAKVGRREGDENTISAPRQ
jgi:hypothetical protein